MTPRLLSTAEVAALLMVTPGVAADESIGRRYSAVVQMVRGE